VPDRRVNRVIGADALPVPGWKADERHKFLPIFLQALRGLEIPWLLVSENQIECLERIGIGRELPDVVYRSLGLWMR